MVPQLGKVDETGLLRLKSANQRLMWKSLLSPSPTGKKKRFTFPQTGRGKRPGIPSESRGKLLKLYLHRLCPRPGGSESGQRGPMRLCFSSALQGA